MKTALLCLASALVSASTAQGPPPPDPDLLVDERTIDFREHAEPGRVVARVRAALVLARDGVRLRIAASATGPRVAAAPGPEGVHGGNRIAAEELDALLRGGALSLRVRGPRGASSAAGESPAVVRGALVVRAMDADGRVAHVAAGGGDLALEATLATGALADGISRVEVVADGRARVRAVVRAGPGGARLLALEQIEESAP
jgi:hypothetical protein